MCVLPLHLVIYIFTVLQQTAANGDQIIKLEERIDSLGEFTKPSSGQDNEEKARREALWRFVLSPLREILVHRLIALSTRRKIAEVISGLEALSKQCKISKFFKHVDHAETLNGFVQDLEYAVSNYQV